MIPLKTGKIKKIWIVFGFAVILFLLFFRPPLNFSESEVIIIREGLTLNESAKVLKEKNVIISETTFSILTRLFDGKVVAGGYLFKEPLSVFEVVFKVSRGDYGTSLIKVTFPEGLSSKEMAEICSTSLSGCNKEEFFNLGRKEEGYLFPDTYFFSQSSGANEVISIMRKTFDEKIKNASSSLEEFGRPLKDVLTMASILEKEAKSMEDRRIVAGILWKRLDLKMPLQVDAAFDYVIGKTTFELTGEDLKIDSPYNTYRFLGLPPTPIGNPGLASIEAATTPIKTKYFFYLTGKDGTFHYAEDHDTHVLNKEKYLR